MPKKKKKSAPVAAAKPATTNTATPASTPTTALAPAAATTPAVAATPTVAPQLSTPATVATASDSGGDNQPPVVLAIKVNFMLVTPDRLRKVVFGLEKDTQGNTVIWKIDFQLFERDKISDAFSDPIADLHVEVDHHLHPQAATAAQNGLTPGQQAHATGPGADDVKAAKNGDIDQSDANQSVQNTLAVK
jgi:hypothetical protein